MPKHELDRTVFENNWTKFPPLLALPAKVTHSHVVDKLAAESPDINAIENLWHEMKHFLRKTVKPRNIRKNFYQAFEVSVNRHTEGMSAIHRHLKKVWQSLSRHTYYVGTAISTNKQISWSRASKYEPLTWFSTCTCSQLLTPATRYPQRVIVFSIYDCDLSMKFAVKPLLWCETYYRCDVLMSLKNASASVFVFGVDASASVAGPGRVRWFACFWAVL